MGKKVILISERKICLSTAFLSNQGIRQIGVDIHIVCLPVFTDGLCLGDIHHMEGNVQNGGILFL